MSRSRVVSAVASLVGLAAAQVSADYRSPRFFAVDPDRRIASPSPEAPAPAALDPASVSVDQPRFRPGDAIHLRLVLPGRAGARVTAALQRPDSRPIEVKGELDGQGVAVLTLDGEGQRLPPGEYRVEVRTGDARPVGTTTFAVRDEPGDAPRSQSDSSPVEHTTLAASGGVSWLHRVGFSPAGRAPLFAERQPGADDPFAVDSVVASTGALTIRVTRDLTSPAFVVWTPRADGTFEPRPQQLPAALKAGQAIAIPVGAPYSLVTVGGFVGPRFHEGWALAFVPSELEPSVEAPAFAAPGSKVSIDVWVRDRSGAGVAASGLLEVFDEQLDTPSPARALDLALEQSVRTTSASLAARKDRPRVEKQAPSSRSTRRTQDDPPPVPQAEHQVVHCGAVRTDASGLARVEIVLPPRAGRLSVRFLAVRGLEHAEATRTVEVARRASAEALVPATFVQGTRLQIPVVLDNTLEAPVTLAVSGEGLAASPAQKLGPGRHEVQVPWVPTRSGSVRVEVTAADGTLLQREDLPFLAPSAQRVTFSRLLIAGREPIAVAADETAVVYAGPGTLLRGLVASQLNVLEGWFGHAEALSARIAAKALLLSACSRRLLDEGLAPRLRAGLEQDLRRLEESFFDARTGLVRPYPGLATSTLWSARVSANLHRTARALPPGAEPALAAALERTNRLTQQLDAALQAHGVDTLAQGYDTEGRDVLPIELKGQVAHRPLGDEAVRRWVAKTLLPALGPDPEDLERAFVRAGDRFPFLVSQRGGARPYLTAAATALWLGEDRAAFNPLFARLARGLVLAQEPGMLHGPSTLGGAFASPLGTVRFLELLLAMADDKPTTNRFTVGTASGSVRVTSGTALTGVSGTSISPPAGAVVRLDRPGTIALFDGVSTARPLARADLAPRDLRLGHRAFLQVALDPKLDPLEYFAVVAVPTVTAVKPTPEALSDHARVLAWGQPAAVTTPRMQVVAVPFGGSRTLRLMLEATWAGSAAGAVAIRHLEDPRDRATLVLPTVTVKGP